MMKKLEAALKSLIKNLGIEQTVLENQVVQYYPIVVGQRIAEVSQAEKIENGILFIKVINSTWRNELYYYKKDIIQKLNKKIGETIVKEIKFI